VKRAGVIELLGPPNAIRFESADQTGLQHAQIMFPSLRPNWVTPVPSEFITYTRENSRSTHRQNAIIFPSGDQLG
jgi:hypothetical protein